VEGHCALGTDPKLLDFFVLNLKHFSFKISSDNLKELYWNPAGQNDFSLT